MDPNQHPERQGKCPGTNRQGKPCGKGAGAGTLHKGYGLCASHTGATPNGEKHGQRLAVEAEVQRMKLSLTDLSGRRRDAVDVLLDEVTRTAILVEWLSQKVQELEEEALVRGVREVRETVGSDAEQRERTTVVSAALNVLVTWLHQERRHLVDVCKAALSHGVEERYVQLAEREATVMVQVLQATAAELGFGEHPDFVATVAKHLRLVS